MTKSTSPKPSGQSQTLYQRRELVAAAAALLAGCGGGGGGSAASTSSSPKLPAITAGTPPQLRGAGILPHTDWLLSNSYRWANIDYLPNAGANCVRLFLQPFSWVDGSALLPGQVLANRITESLKLWTDVINAFLAKNVYVILTINLETSYPAYGVWPNDGRSIWKDSTAQDEYVATWVALATRFAGRAGILFDLMNEPHGISADEVAGNHALPKTVWNALHVRIKNAVRAVDANRWLIVETIWGDGWNFPDLQTNGDAKTIYSYHYYGPHYFTHQGNSGWPTAGSVQYPGLTQDYSWQTPKQWGKAELQADMAPAATFATTNSARVMLGEFGSSRGAAPADRAAWTTDVLSVINGTGQDFVYFQYDGWAVPANFSSGWAFENSPVEALLTAQFAKNKVSA
jgi:Cellulase (glycosyl hydrolase family 5)